MAIIYSYPKSLNILDTDTLIGTTTQIVNNRPKNQTKSFKVEDLAAYFSSQSTVPSLQQVSDVGKVVSYPDGVSGMVINIDDAIGNTYSGLTINGTSGANGLTVNGLTAIIATGTDIGIQATGGFTGIEVIGNEIGINAKSTGISGVFNNDTDATNIVEFRVNDITKASVSGNGTIVGNRLLVNTTDPSGADKVKIDGSLIATTIKKLGGTSSQILLADGSTSSLNDKITYKLKTTYALMIADGTPTVPTIYSVTNDENKSYTRSTYLWKADGNREWIASTPDN